VGAGGDVHQVLLAVWIEAVGAREVVQRREHLLEVPRVTDREQVRDHAGGRRDLGQVGGDLGEHRAGVGPVPQLDPIDRQVGVAAHRDGRAPAGPALRLGAAVERGAEEAEDDPALAGWHLADRIADYPMR
jgi:hypothetical protein